MKRFVHVLIVSFFALIVTLPSIAYAEEGVSVAKPDVYKIVALGDSITVGYEKGMNEKSVPYGYAERIYEQALFRGRAQLANYAILGLTTPGLTKLLEGAQAGRSLTADDLQDYSGFPDPRTKKQADSIAARASEIAPALADANLVVLTVGGNDFGDFIKKMFDNDNDAKTIMQTEFDTNMNNYTANVDTLMRKLHEMAPNAEIVLADQYLPFLELHPLYKDLLANVYKLSAALDELATKLQADGIPLRIARVSDKFAYQVKEFTYFTAIEPDNHPKQAGYEAMAKAYVEAIDDWKTYLAPKPKPEGVTLSVIVNGQELPYKPINKNNTNFLPIGDLATAVQAERQWDKATKTVTLSKNNHVVKMTIGASYMYVDGVRIKLETPPAFIQAFGKEGKTYVPIAVIVKALDFDLVYRNPIQTAFINS
ncbi:stalk domain-containing protein [Cohnella panacarvi]|uniref:stalk domain-containing protein n=1 Tax=Cohnella panacarvi TaxID=400776 RepID=UPI0004AD409E|nr:stalk domain-containing protein [Cohnella panacarvi]